MRYRRALLATCGLTLSLSLMAPLASLAQDATPAAGSDAQPASCDAEPRDLDELVALWFDESGAPAATPTAAMMVQDEATLPDGPKPEDADVAAIGETTHQWLYCINIAGDYARGFNLMTDNLVSQFGPDTTNPNQDTLEEVHALLEAQSAATPVPSTEGQLRLPALGGPRKARLLEDGRVGAIWSIGGDRVFITYENVDGTWLVDEVADIADPVEGTPTADATPAP
ncbi:MAG: hypothetical protein M3Z20_05065 [Chloroflexota bacterium]|nr:hypothetical protein [Chloroflexota bacterium]